ncbi:hypothetical protein JCM11491_003472 [Sporobolomyces phaffii]
MSLPTSASAAAPCETNPLPLVRGTSPVQHSILSTLHFVLLIFAVLIKLPFYLAYHYIFFRHRSPLVAAGRHPVAEVVNHIAKTAFSHAYLAPGRAVFATQLFLKGDCWFERVTTDQGVKGTWIRPPSTSRIDDDLVLYWIHGGAFNHDIVGSNLPFFKALALNLNNDSQVPRQFSLFVLDYHLAPEKVYPSQLVELDAGYRYLTQTLGIDADKICLGGDSAGGNLVSSYLLHLVQSNPTLLDPRPCPSKPGSVLLMSPWNSLLPLASRPSRCSSAHSTLDFLSDPSVTVGAYHYLGLEAPFSAGPSWNPLKWFGIVRDELPISGAEAGQDDDDDGKSGSLFDDPFVSPGPESVSSAWYGNAFPHAGKTCVIWGGMEIFADDINAFVDALKTAGASPVTGYDPLKTHDWPLFDFAFPFMSRTKARGRSSRYDFGLNQIADFLQSVSTTTAPGVDKC